MVVVHSSIISYRKNNTETHMSNMNTINKFIKFIKDNKHTILHTIEGIIILILLLCLQVQSMKKETITEYVKVEVHDTISIDKPRIVEHTKTLYRTKYDTIIVNFADTITDTIKVELPIEHKEFIDTIRTDSTTAVVDVHFSGFKPSLDKIDISYHYEGKKAVKTKKYKMGQSIVVGPYVGFGLTLEQQPRLVPEVGVGVMYGFGCSW